MIDEEYIEAFDHFVVGNFAAALDLSVTARPSPEWDALVARCHLALGHMEKVKEMARSASASPAVAATGYFAVFQKSPAQKVLAMDKIAQVQGDPVSGYFLAIARAATDLLDGFRVAQSVVPPSSELNALQVQLALCMHRPDLARKIFGEKIAHDDSAAAKLAAALLANPADAYMCYSDLIAQFRGPTPSEILCNGRAVANMQRGLYAEAQEDLEHLNGEDGLANLVSCYAHQGKSADARQIYERLKTTHPSHPLVQKREALRAVFAH